MAKTIQELEEELGRISLQTRRAYDALNSKERKGLEFEGLYRQLAIAENTLKKKGVFESARKEAEATIKELTPKIKAAEAEYKKFQEQKNALNKELKQLKAQEKEDKEKEVRGKSAGKLLDKSLEELSRAELSLEGYKGEEKYIAAYKKAQEAYNAALESGVTPQKALPQAKIAIPVEEGQAGAAGQGTEESAITGPQSYSDALNFLTDPKNKESLIQAQKALSKFGYKGNTTGEPDITFTAALNKAALEYRNLPQPWRTGSLLDYIVAPISGGAGTGTGAGKEAPITDYPVISSPTDAKSKINAVFQQSLDRDATAAEIKELYPILKQAQLDNPTSYKETTINGKKARVQYTSLDTNQFILDQINKNPVLKQELTTIKQQAPDLTKRLEEKKIYDKMIKAAKGDPDKIAAAKATTAYGRGIDDAAAALAEYAMKTGADVTEEELQQLATEVYDKAIENNPVQIRNLIRGMIGDTRQGQAGNDYAELKAVAVANGLDLDKTFGSNLNEWLQKIDKGESIDTYKRLIRNTAKIGMPQNVAALLDNGVDLEAIYSPYKNLMAATLEINPETIDLNDPVLRSAVTGDKEVPLYEFQRQLRKDSRWQYTNQAKQEVSDVALKVLRDFGFQG